MTSVKLTSNQKYAVNAKKGNYLVMAAGGSGKSSVFVARIASLIMKDNVMPEKVLGLTFTKDAAENVRNRLNSYIGQSKAKKIDMSTFHSFAYRFLKREFPTEYANINIIQSWMENSIASDIVSKPNRNNPNGLGLGILPAQLVSFVSYQKANLVRKGDEIILTNKTKELEDIVGRRLLQSAFDIYCTQVSSNRVYSFDDLLLETYYLLLNDDELLNKVRNSYEYILVDEFQDTSTANMEILKLIGNDNLFVVGDFRQSIYSFSSAEVDNVLEFKNEFDDVEIIELEDNFRSTDAIIEISNDVINSSPDERYAQFKEANGAREVSGDPVNITIYNNQMDEIELTIKDIKDKVENHGYNFSDFAILSRTNNELGLYETRLSDDDIPVRISGGKSFYDKAEIVDIISYLRIALDVNDTQSFQRIINKPNRYISKSIINKHADKSYNNKTNIEYELHHSKDLGRAKGNINNLLKVIEDIRSRIEDMSAYDIIKYVYERTNYKKDQIEAKATTLTEYYNKTESLDSFLESSRGVPSAKAFLQKIDIIKANNKKNKDEDALNLSTIHSAKGLEYKVVYAVGMNDKNYPHEMDIDYEESRRLVYVAFSRAKDELNVSYPVYQIDEESTKPSPFLIDIDGDNINKVTREVISEGKKYSSYNYKGGNDERI